MEDATASVEVQLTSHLLTFFPQLPGRTLRVLPGTAAEVVRQLDEIAPGLRFYLCDETGSLRTHVNLFIGEERVVDRARLRDRVAAGQKVYVMQALSGG